MMQLTKLYYSQRELAELCGVSVTTIKNWVNHALIPGADYSPTSGKKYYHRATVAKILANGITENATLDSTYPKDGPHSVNGALEN